MASFSIRNFTRRPLPALPFARAAAMVLPGWDISLVVAGRARAKRYNEVLRKKTYVPNVLSYEAGPRNGEIIVCPDVFAKQAPQYGYTEKEYCFFLFIHGLLHLKGEQHGITMDSQERALVARFIGVPSSRSNGSTNRNRHRHRHRPNQGRRR